MLTSLSSRQQQPFAANPLTEGEQLQPNSQTTAVYTPAAERFRLVWDGALLSFSDITGLDAPAMRVTFNNGHYLGDGAFWTWFNRIKSTRMQRMEISLSEYDELGIEVRRWTLHEAWPVLLIAAPGIPVGAPGVSSLVIEHRGVTGTPI